MTLIPKVGLQPGATNNIGKDIIYARITKDNQLINVEQGTNNFTVVDANTKSPMVNYPGTRETPYGNKKIKSFSIDFDRFRSLRFAKEDAFPIWRKGGTSIVMMNPTNYEIFGEYFNFFPNNHTPMFVNVSGKMNKIIGCSLNEEESTSTISILDDWRNPSSSSTNFINVSKGETWAGMELNTEGDILIGAIQTAQGGNSQYLKMGAYDFSSGNLNPLSQTPFTEPEFSQVQFMRKVKGYDIFAVACDNNIAIIAFTGRDFYLINLLRNLYEGMIFEIAIKGDYMIPVTVEPNENMKVLEFGKGSYASMVNRDMNKPNRIDTSKYNLLAGVFANQNIKKISTPNLGKFFFFYFF